MKQIQTKEQVNKASISNTESDEAQTTQQPETVKPETDALSDTNNPEMEKFFFENKEIIKNILSELLNQDEQMLGEATTQVLEAKERELAEKEKQLNFQKLQMDTFALLEAKSIPTNVMKLIIGSDMEDTIQNIDIFQKTFDEAVQIQVERRFANKTPTFGSVSLSKDTKVNNQNTIRNILNRG